MNFLWWTQHCVFSPWSLYLCHLCTQTGNHSYLCLVETGAWTAGRWRKERAGRPPAPGPLSPGRPPSARSQCDGKPLHCRASSARVRSATPRPPPWPGSEAGTPARWRAPAALIPDGPSPAWCLHLSCWLRPRLQHHCVPFSQLTHWNRSISPNRKKKLESAMSWLVPQLAHAALRRAARPESSSTGSFRLMSHKAASVLRRLFEVADDVDADDDEICRWSSLSPPQPTTAAQQQVDRRHTEQGTRSRNTRVNKCSDLSHTHSFMAHQSGAVSAEIT